MGFAQIFLTGFILFGVFNFVEAKRVMVTAFEPFAGAAVNRSQDAAQRIKSQLNQQGIEVDICTVPVVYDLGSQIAKKCFQDLSPKPDLVLSLGEGGCQVQMETAAHNRDSTPGYPDNAGQIRVEQKIDLESDQSLAFGSFVSDMYCSLNASQREEVVISESPGGFVCNNTAFLLGHYFKKIKIPYSFIHVPANGCSEDNQLALNAGDTIAEMIKTLPFINKNFSRQSIRYTCTLLPTTLNQILQVQKVLSFKDPTPQNLCAKEFNQRLSERLSEWTNKNTTY